MARALRIFAVALITAGLVMLIDAGMTVAWKEPVSAAYGKIKQSQAAADYERLRDSFVEEQAIGETLPAKPSQGELRKKTRKLAERYDRRIEIGDAIAQLLAPSMGVDATVLQGTDSSVLKRGPGHYPETDLPGMGGTVAIAGHRTTYGAPFRNINDAEVGDEITVEMPYGNFVYEVTKTEIVDPSEVRVVRDVGRERLVLTACHPLYSAAERYVVTADLADVLPPSGG